MEEMFCLECQLHHKKATMVKSVTRGGRTHYLCPACHERMKKSMSLAPAVKKARLNMVKKNYQKGGKSFEQFIKFCTRGD